MSVTLTHIIYRTSVVGPVWGWGEKKTTWKYLVFFSPLGQYFDLKIGEEQYIHVVLICDTQYVMCLVVQSVVVRLFATLWTVAHQAPLSMEFFRILEWVAISSCRGSSQPKD